jgi:hypothetical protein
MIMKGLVAMTAGLGGQQPPPVNAPRGQATPPGVQPGVSGTVLRARQVLVYISSTQYISITSSGIEFYDNGAVSFISQFGENGLQIDSGGSPNSVFQITGGAQGSAMLLGASAVQLVNDAGQIPLAALSEFPVSGSATLATAIAALNALYAALQTGTGAGIFS